MNQSPPQQQQQQHGLLDPRLLPESPQTRNVYGVDQQRSASAYEERRRLGHELAAMQVPQSRSVDHAPDNGPYYTMPGAVKSDEGDLPGFASIEIPETGGEDDSMNESPHLDASNDAKRPRACEACRGLKVRCDQDPAQPDQPCKRCAKAGRQCVITQPTRKRQKKADSRVAELEKKLDACLAVLQAQGQGGALNLNQLIPSAANAGQQQIRDGPAQYPQSPVPAVQNSQAMPDGFRQGPYFTGSAEPALSNKRRRVDEPDNTVPQQRQSDNMEASGQVGLDTTAPSCQQQADPIVPDAFRLDRESDIRRLLYHTDPEAIIAKIRSMLDQELAEEIFHRYVHDFAPHMPAVMFPANTTADEILKSKPVLFLTILASGGAGLVSEEVQLELHKESVAAIADCVFRHSAKSLELIQAMQVAVLWYRPPNKAEHTSFYQLIHMAAVMALDLGLGKQFNPSKARRGFWGAAQDLTPGPRPGLLVDSDTVEARRAWLTCYYLCASTSMVLRRPNLVRWTNYMNDCIEILETSPDALPSDRFFAQHVKIQHICDEIGSSFSMDDSSATSVSITDPKVTYALSVFEKQLKEWESNIPEDLRKPELLYFRDATSLYLHEIALHVNHNTDDFRVPFTEETLRSGNQHLETLTPKQMAAVEACLHATHGILETYCSFSPSHLIGLPTLLYFVRVIYAVVVLIKMHIAATLPDSELGKMLKPEEFHTAEYLDRLWALFSNMGRHQRWRQHNKVMRILGVLREWFATHKDPESLAQSESNNRARPNLQSGKTSAPQQQQYQWPPKGDGPLRLLSEAATVGSSDRKNVNDSSSNHNHTSSSSLQSNQRNADPANIDTSWTFDSPFPVPRKQIPATWSPFSTGCASQNINASTDTSSQHNTSSLATGYTSIGTGSAGGFATDSPHGSAGSNAGGGGQNQGAGGGDFDWTAGLDFQQALDVALLDFDASGDFGDWILGDGPGAFQLPHSDGQFQGQGQQGQGQGQGKW